MVGAGKAILLSLFLGLDDVLRDGILLRQETLIVSSPSEMLPELLSLFPTAGFAVETALTSAAGKASLPSRPPLDSVVYDGILMHDESLNVGRTSDTVQSL